MNKKFSTLVASLLLATTVGTVSAATEKGVASSYPRQVAESIDGKFYQLSDGYNVLAMEQKADGSFILKFVPYGEAELAKTLWEIRSLDNKDEKGLSFQFYNVSTGLPISFDSKLATKFGSTLTATPLSQGVSSWSWVRGVEGDPLLTPTALESFFSAEKDSVITLMNTADGVAAVKYATKDQASVTGDIQVKPMEASPVYLNAYDLNTMLQTGKSKLHLNFNPNVSADAKTNEFTGAEGDREFTVKDAVAQNSLSLSLVTDAQGDADSKKATYDALAAELTEATETFISLDGQFQDVTIKWDAAKQKHQDAVNERNAEKGAYNTAVANIDEYTEKKDAYISQYEAALILSEADRKAWDDARITRLAALSDRDEKRATLSVELSKYTELEDARNTASLAFELATAENNVAKNVYNGIKAVLADAATQSMNGAAYVATIESNKNYVKIKNNDLEAAESLVSTLSAITGKLKTILTTDYQTAYLRPYLEVYNDTKKAYSDAKKVADSTQDALDNQTPIYEAAVEASQKADKKFDNADAKYQEVLAQWESSSTTANEIWGQVDECQRIIDENTTMRDNTLERWMALEAEIPVLWADVLKYAEEFSEKGTEYGLAQVKVQQLNAETFEAWNIWQAALNYLNSISDKAENWYSLQYSDGSYLMVDTAYLESNASVKHQTFALKKFESAEVKYPGIEKMTARDINGRFNFRFLYYPTIDSLVITADGGNDLPAGNRYWRDYRPVYDMEGRNYVKLAVLGNGTNEHREVTLGAPYDIYTGNAAPQMTLNTRINLSLIMNTPGVEIPKGVYFADIVDEKDTQKNGARLMLDLDGELTKVTPAAWDNMKFEDMPAAKWVVDGTTIFGGSPNIMNQESAETLNNGRYQVLEVKDGVVLIKISSYDYQNGVRVDETVKLTPVKEENKNGYYNQRFDKNTTSVFTFDYLNVTAGASIQVGTASNDTILRVAEGEATKFVLESAKDKNDKYGVANAFEKGLYYIRVNDANKLDNNYKYVTISTVDGTEHLVVTNKKDKSEISSFYLKELNHVGDVHYYALISGDKKVGVMPASGLIMAEDITGETTTATFALNADTTEYYRTFTADELAKNMKFYRTADHAYLYADKGLLEFENKQTEAGDLANLEVIPAVTEGTIMPQYLVGKITKVVEGDTIWCNATASHKHETLADSLACPHTTIIKDTTFVNFMTNLKIDAKLDKANLFENKYSRVGFMDGYITDGKLYWTVEDKEYNVALNENKHHPAKFQFRLVEEGSNDFLIESESWGYDKDKNYLPFEGGVRPFENGGWLKIQNAVPVIVRTDYEDAVASGETFNVEAGSDITANETISTSNVVVAGVNGAVVVKGAEGKNVIVSTILGKVVANEVVSSDNAQITAPAGVVVVSVDGESFKVVVK